MRAYVQVETPSWVAAHPGVSQHVPLENELLDGTIEAVMIDGQQAYGVTSPQWLGPVILATKNKPVRVVFRNLLPNGADGDLFLPTDSTLMGSGMGPMGLPDPVDEGTVMDEVRNPDLHRGAQVAGLLQGQPGDPAPPRRHQPVDQRRYAAPVDHPGQRGHSVA